MLAGRFDNAPYLGEYERATAPWRMAVGEVDYMMPRDAEMALARSAAPPNISGRVTIKVLTTSGFQVAPEGDNGFVCLVMRGWSAPTFTPAEQRDLVYDATVRGPICFAPPATRMVLPFSR